jgi:8-oxo-dGTP pyrophosphatase MutT (NUDIX family)
MIKHATAGAFLFHSDQEQWRVGLIEHPRLGKWMAPGGHVENDETPYEGGIRETEEETGLRGLQLIEAPGIALPDGFPPTHKRVPQPWWIIEGTVAADSYTDEPHVHVDYQYAAIVADATPSAAGEHPFAWHTADQIGELPMFEDSRLAIAMLFTQIDSLARTRAGRPEQNPG